MRRDNQTGSFRFLARGLRGELLALRWRDIDKKGTDLFFIEFLLGHLMEGYLTIHVNFD